MKNILVIQTAFLGDVVLATAVIEKLHACLPDASISMLVRKGNESLLKNHPFLKKVIVWDKTKNKIPNLLHTIGEIKKRILIRSLICNVSFLRDYLQSFQVLKLKLASIKIRYHFYSPKKSNI
jgi:ADP-heptose:LPS heptosyltransferase